MSTAGGMQKVARSTSMQTDLQQIDVYKRQEYGWWKVTKGQVDFTFNGLAQNENGWFAVQGGRVNFECNGLVQNEYRCV